MGDNVSIKSLIKGNQNNIENKDTITIKDMIDNIKNHKKQKTYNLQDIIKEKQNIEKYKKAMYEEIYNDAMRQIHDAVIQCENNLIYEIPMTYRLEVIRDNVDEEIIKKQSLYNFDECKSYLFEKLKNDNFVVEMLYNYSDKYMYNQVLISWRFIEFFKNEEVNKNNIKFNNTINKK